MRSHELILSGNDRSLIKKEKPKTLKQLQSEAPPKKEAFIRKVLHKPTYCVTKIVNSDGSNIKQNRHKLSPFHEKKQVQSNQSTSRLSQAVNWMLLFSDLKSVYSKKENKTFRFRLAFITLTLSEQQKHSDKYIKEHMLQPFLYWLWRYHQASYVQKSETQLNGNIHFHITIDSFIHWKSIRAKWNKILAKHSYCKVFQDGTNDKGNAATQIKAVKNEADIARYIANYMAKKNIYKPSKYKKFLSTKTLTPWTIFLYISITKLPDDDNLYLRFIDGRLWSCSENLSKINISLDESHANFLSTEQQFFAKNDVERLGDKLVKKDMKKNEKLTEEEKQLLKLTEYDLKQKYYHLMNVYTHKNLQYGIIPPSLRTLIMKEKEARKFNPQTKWIIDSIKE